MSLLITRLRMQCRWRVSSSRFFFFQAEDGIRDLTVTGVQTCALPILEVEVRGVGRERGAPAHHFGERRRRVHLLIGHHDGYSTPTPRGERYARMRATQIGRASCRERV